MTALKKNKLLMMLVIIFMLLNNSIIYAFDLERKISKNVYIGEIDVSDLTIEEATKKVNLYIEENRYFNLIYNDKKIKIDKNTFDLDYKIPQLAQNAYNVGRDKDIITNIKTKVSLKRGNKEIIPIVSYYNISKIDELIKQLNEQFYISPVNATAEVINDKVAVTKGSYGQNINKQQLKSIIIYKIDNLNSKDSEIPITVLKPKYTSKQLSKIDTLLGSYETYFNPKNINRVNNISVATQATSNVIINTNEKFSFNNELREKNVYNQLREAPIILNGKPDKGVGGGICQVSTTIYNAALYAGMDIVEITNHSIPSPYVNKGRDATVCEGAIDFVFKNRYNTPIIVHNTILSNKIVSNIYGSSDDKSDIEIDTEVIETITNKKIYKNNSKLRKDVKVVEQPGRLGYTVNTFRIYKSNGEILKKELINKSYYPPCDEIIFK